MISTTIVALLASSAVFAAPCVFAGEKTVIDVDNFKIVAKVTNRGDETLLLNDPRAPNYPSLENQGLLRYQC